MDSTSLARRTEPYIVPSRGKDDTQGLHSHCSRLEFDVLKRVRIKTIRRHFRGNLTDRVLHRSRVSRGQSAIQCMALCGRCTRSEGRRVASTARRLTLYGARQIAQRRLHCASDAVKGGARMIRPLPIEKTRLDTWFERDRAHVALIDETTDQTIVEFWDEAVSEAIEDGFLTSRNLHGSAYDYAASIGLLPVVESEAL